MNPTVCTEPTCDTNAYKQKEYHLGAALHLSSTKYYHCPLDTKQDWDFFPTEALPVKLLMVCSFDVTTGKSFPFSSWPQLTELAADEISLESSAVAVCGELWSCCKRADICSGVGSFETVTIFRPGDLEVWATSAVPLVLLAWTGLEATFTRGERAPCWVEGQWLWRMFLAADNGEVVWRMARGGRGLLPALESVWGDATLERIGVVGVQEGDTATTLETGLLKLEIGLVFKSNMIDWEGFCIMGVLPCFIWAKAATMVASVRGEPWALSGVSSVGFGVEATTVAGVLTCMGVCGVPGALWFLAVSAVGRVQGTHLPNNKLTYLLKYFLKPWEAWTLLFSHLHRCMYQSVIHSPTPSS